MSMAEPVAYLSRRYRFASGHRLYSPDLSDQENRAIFGKCNNPKGHGHNYILFVTVKGFIDPVTGMCFNLAELDRLVGEHILSRYDHRDLNREVEEYSDVIPTGENIARRIWEKLEAVLPPGKLHKIRVVETSNNAFEYYG